MLQIVISYNSHKFRDCNFPLKTEKNIRVWIIVEATQMWFPVEKCERNSNGRLWKMVEFYGLQSAIRETFAARTLVNFSIFHHFHRRRFSYLVQVFLIFWGKENKVENSWFVVFLVCLPSVTGWPFLRSRFSSRRIVALLMILKTKMIMTEIVVLEETVRSSHGGRSSRWL